MAKIVSLGERSQRLVISIKPKILEQLDDNVCKLRNFLMTEYNLSDVQLKGISRSALVREMVELLGTEEGFNLLTASIKLNLSVGK